jgi:small subunit ribosomal protein S15
MSETKASWVTAKPEEIKKRIIELAEQGKTAEKIGLILRDQDGIPKVKLLGIKIGMVLKENKLWSDPETVNVEKRIENMTKHAQKHKHDYKTMRTLVKRTARLKKLKEE